MLHAHFENLRVLIEHIQLRMRTRDMGDTYRTYNHEEEVKELYVTLGNAGIGSNGNIEGKVENIELLDKMRCLERDVWSYIEYNERINRD
jgi:hypothetical protein